MEPLVGMPLAALRCKHVYHHDCISQWIRAGTHALPRCPICREKAKRGDVIGPLFFTIPATDTTPGGQTTTMTTGETEDTLDLSYATDLQTNFVQVHKNLEEKTALLDQANQQIERLKSQAILTQTENLRLQEAHSRTQMQLRYVKTLRGVQELDTAVQSPSAQARMRQWKELPSGELSLILGSLYERASMVESERAQWKRKDRMQQEELNILRLGLEKSEQKRKKMVLRKQDYEREIEQLKAAGNTSVGMPGPSSSSSKRRIAPADDDETDSNATDDEAPTATKKIKPVAIELSSDSDTDDEGGHIPIVGRSKPIHPKRLELFGIAPQPIND